MHASIPRPTPPRELRGPGLPGPARVRSDRQGPCAPDFVGLGRKSPSSPAGLHHFNSPENTQIRTYCARLQQEDRRGQHVLRQVGEGGNSAAPLGEGDIRAQNPELPVFSQIGWTPRLQGRARRHLEHRRLQGTVLPTVHVRGPRRGEEGGLEVGTHRGHSERLVPDPRLPTLLCGAGTSRPGCAFRGTEAADSGEALNRMLRRAASTQTGYVEAVQ